MRRGRFLGSLVGALAAACGPRAVKPPPSLAPPPSTTATTAAAAASLSPSGPPTPTHGFEAREAGLQISGAGGVTIL